MENYFTKLNDINVSEKVEKKNGLSYLSWAYAWGEIKKQHPNAQYKVYENENGWNYFTDMRTCWVKVSVAIDELEHIEYLPVMNNSNKSIALDNVTSFDVNKAIQRAITKACARHGLGLYIYAGEDLPESENGSDPAKDNAVPTAQQLAQLKKIGRTVAHVAKKYDVEEKAVTSKHVADYIQAVIDYQKEQEAKKQAEAEQEAEEIFSGPEWQ